MQFQIDLNRPVRDVLTDLDKLPVQTRVSLTGTIIVARDIAHAKLKERLDKGEGLPDYFINHPVIYAGPSKTPEVHGNSSWCFVFKRIQKLKKILTIKLLQIKKS